MVFSVPATSANLGPGFDTLGVSLDYRNIIKISAATSQSIKIFGKGYNKVKLESDNIFVKIFTKTLQSLGGGGNFSFEFYNKIPISRGLGSSSAVIVGAIFSAYKICDKIPLKQDVLNLALKYENHPDNIAPATYGGFCINTLKVIKKESKGQKAIKQVLSIKKSMPKSVRAVIVIPNKPISTKQSRTILPKSYQIQDSVINISNSSFLSALFLKERWGMLKQASQDMLHEHFRMSTYPVLFDIRKTAYENGALLCTLSGSGSSMFSLCYKDDSKNLAKKLQEKFQNFKILDINFDNDGVKIDNLR